MALILLVSACPAKPRPQPGTASQSKEITLLFTAELKGQLEPCGCTTDPLGDLARLTEYLETTRKQGPTLVIDGGSTLFSFLSPAPGMQFQEAQKAQVITSWLPDAVDAAGLGPFDLVDGPARVKHPRHAVNVPEGSVPLARPTVLPAGGVKVGVFGVVDPRLVEGATDPAPAATGAVAELRKHGADLVVGIAHMDRAAARKLARSVKGVDIVLVGKDAPEDGAGARPPEEVGGTWLVQPVNRGQSLTRMDVRVAPGGDVLVDAIGPARAEALLEELAADIDKLTQRLADWRAQPDADSDFVARKEQELTLLEARRERLATKPLVVPDKGSWFTAQEVFVKKGMDCAPKVQAAKLAYDKAVGAHNLAAAKGETAPPVSKGQAGYAGVEECSYCHADQVAFWKTTSHARAWETLTSREKQFNRECIGCHVTGWQKPGGSVLGDHDELMNVQCETCHGPGSLHVDADGKRTDTLVLVPERNLCYLACHTPEHSDTFEFEAYLRTVTGPGHGEAFRKSLGEGPTGRELRQAALAKAGTAVGKHCRK